MTRSTSGSASASLVISSSGDLEATGPYVDFVKVYFKVDGGPETLWVDITGGTSPTTLQLPIGIANQVDFRVEGKTTCNCESYSISNFVLVDDGLVESPPPPTEAPAPPPPVASPTEAPVPPPVPLPSTSCDLSWAGNDVTITSDGYDTTEIISTSCANEIEISVDSIVSQGDLEANGTFVDTLQIFYKIDDSPEVNWLDVTGNLNTLPPPLTLVAGDTLLLRTVGKTSSFSEQ